MATISISQEEFNCLQAKVSDLEEKVMVLLSNKSDNEKPKQASRYAIPFKRGAAKGIITYIAEDFDAPLEDLKEYM
jgi:hypothetical protein